MFYINKNFYLKFHTSINILRQMKLKIFYMILWKNNKNIIL